MSGIMIRFKDSKAVSYLVMIAGSILAAFALEQILIPTQIMDGGMVGIAMIISVKTGAPLGLLTVLLNLPLVWAGGRKLSKTFIIRTVIAMAVFSAALTFFGSTEFYMTDDKLLSTVFGGLLLGFGVGLVLHSGGCLDGTEAAAIMISKRFSLSVGQIVLGFNILIYLCAGMLFGIDRRALRELTASLGQQTEQPAAVQLRQRQQIECRKGEIYSREALDTEQV